MPYTSIMHMPIISLRSKVLNHRSNDFYFFMYIFGWFSQEFPLESYRYTCLEKNSFSIRQFDWPGFLSIACELCTKIGTVRDPSECAGASKVATRCRSDAFGSYLMTLKLPFSGNQHTTIISAYSITMTSQMKSKLSATMIWIVLFRQHPS